MLFSDPKYKQTHPETVDARTLSQTPYQPLSKSNVQKPLPRIRHGHLRMAGRELSTPIVLTAAFEATLLTLAAFISPTLYLMAFPASSMPAPTMAAATFAGMMLIALTSVGFYRRGLRIGFTAILLRLVGAFMLTSIGIGFLHYMLPHAVFAYGPLSLAFALALPPLLLFRLVVVPVLDHSAFARRVLVIGTGEVASSFNRLRRKADQRGFVISGFIRWKEAQVKVRTRNVITLATTIRDYARAHQIDDIVIALDDQRGTLPINDLVHCKMDGIRVLDVADFLEREGGLLKLDILRPSTLVFSHNFRHSLYRNAVKRVVDLAASIGLLLVSLPFMLLTALAIFIESRGKGSILYSQVRVGENGQPFTLYKFRSMIMTAEQSGACWAQKNDPRVTRIGAFIRKTRLDELPQLYNVIKGDMSFVGPRPERPEFVVDLATKLPYYEWRHWVKPGLTGWAQINYPYGDSEKDAFEKLQFDLYYVKHQSIVLDLLVIMQTVEVVLWGRGSR
jgi:sugar transferase (PEP-CTERM system associated)